MSLPSLLTRSSRLAGLAAFALLAATPVAPLPEPPARWSVAGAARPQWQWPIERPHQVVRPFIAPLTRYSAGHRGIDIAAVPGATVVAPADGVVHFSGVVVDRPLISIRHPDGLISSFEPVDSPLVEGAPVTAGAAVGTVLAGHCPETCLHFGVRLNGEYVSPLNYLGGIRPSVLLPTRSL